jgi:hypothetical protein
MMPMDSMVFPDPPRRADMIILGKSIIHRRIDMGLIGRPKGLSVDIRDNQRGF